MSNTIRFQHDGRRLVIPIVLLPPFQGTDLTFVEASALIDTGATTSGITPRMVKSLSLESIGKRPLGSAHGDAQADRYIFRIGIHSETANGGQPRYPFIFDDVMGFGLKESFRLDALIGMDILRQCEFRMDRSGACELQFG